MKDFISEMKYQENHKNDVDVNYPIKENDTTATIVENIKAIQMESIQDTADLLDISMLDKATQYLIRAKRYGFVYVNREEMDLKDMKRIKKDSFSWYQKVIPENGLAEE